MDIHKEEVREKKLLLFNLRGEALILTGVDCFGFAVLI